MNERNDGSSTGPISVHPQVTAATAAQAVDEQCECHPSGHVILFIVRGFHSKYDV